MWDSLVEIDRHLFEWIHFDLSSDFLDVVFPILRNRETWIPIYILIIYIMLKRFGFKKGAMTVIGLLIAVGISDIFNSHFLKNIIQRIRPCRLDNFTQDVQELVHCGEAFSFPSSHAANHFTIAFFLLLALNKVSVSMKIVILMWASVIGFAQVYVGVHYPADIISGIIVGFVAANLSWFVYKSIILKNKPLY